MKRLLTSCLLLAFLPGSGGAAKKPAKKAKNPTTVSAVNTLLQLERDWAEAGTRQDSKTLERILGDDWVSVDFQGHTVTKAQAIAGLTSAKSPAPALEMGQLKVRIFGDTAVITGRDSSGQFAWMDVFVKRNGRWLAVASQSTKIER